MTDPLVAEYSACTSAYGRLAPLPPVAAADAGWTATAATPATASDAVPAARASVRLRLRMEWNTVAPLDTGDGGVGDRGAQGVQGTAQGVRDCASAGDEGVCRGRCGYGGCNVDGNLSDTNLQYLDTNLVDPY